MTSSYPDDAVAVEIYGDDFVAGGVKGQQRIANFLQGIDGSSGALQRREGDAPSVVGHRYFLDGVPEDPVFYHLASDDREHGQICFSRRKNIETALGYRLIDSKSINTVDKSEYCCLSLYSVFDAWW